MTALSLLPQLVDLAGAVVFAVTGALVASRKEMDIVGFMWLSVVTGVGGGTVRDLVLGAPVFWVEDASPVVACLVTAVVVHFAAHLAQSRYRVILWFDAAGLALVTIAGAAKALDFGVGPVVAVAMGVVTATVGGMLRDVLGQEPSVLLRREIYVTASLAGAVVYVATVGLEGERALAAGLGMATAFVIRGAALQFSWSLPAYKSRPGREQ